ncbi:MAG: alpha/beta fold hydrolase [Spirochaetota bacterium]
MLHYQSNAERCRRTAVLLILMLSAGLRLEAGEAQTLVSTPEGYLAVYWHESRTSQATVILGHGYLNHGRGNQRVIEYFLDKGYAVLAWDLPGHGNSWGEPGAIDDFMQYARAFDAVLVHARQKRPADVLSFVGHSTSCAVFMTWQRELWNTGASVLAGSPFPLETVVLVAPLVRTWLYELSGFGWRVGRWFIKELKPRTSAGSHKPGYGDDFFADPFTVKRMPFSWVASSREWELRTRSWEPDPFPLLILQGTGDTVLDWRYNLQFLSGIYPAARVELVEGGWHCLLDEDEPWVSEVYGLLDREF